VFWGGEGTCRVGRCYGGDGRGGGDWGEGGVWGVSKVGWGGEAWWVGGGGGKRWGKNRCVGGWGGEGV